MSWVGDLWADIPEFPGYQVSDTGLVLRVDTGRILTPHLNQHGVSNIGMMKNGIQCKRSVALLVATAFVPRPRDPRCNAIIHKDGNKDHNWASNLDWRTRAFVHLYNAQFRDPYHNRIDAEVMNCDTGAVYEDTFHAATQEGLLERGVVLSILNEDVHVYPTGHRFALTEN